MDRYLSEYGYLALFFGVLLENAGLPVPGETMLLAAAGFAASGRLSVPMVVVVAALAAVIGDNIGFAVGKVGGRPVLKRWWGGTQAGRLRLEATQTFFERRGGVAIVASRFIPGVRVVAALVAGSSGMRWPRFVVFNVLGAALWAATVTLLGMQGEQLVARLHLASRTIQGLVVAALVAALATITVRWLLGRRQARLTSARRGMR